MNDKINRVIAYKIFNGIRRIHSQYDPTRKKALDKSKTKVPRIKNDGTPSKNYLAFYECAHCISKFPLGNVQVDHIKPVGAYPRFPDDYDNGYFLTWFKNLFCGADNYQVLCKPCHQLKSIQELKDKKK